MVLGELGRMNAKIRARPTVATPSIKKSLVIQVRNFNPYHICCLEFRGT